MSLSREFNTLSGKIVSIAEFRAKLIAEGLDPDKDISPSEAQLAKKVLALQKAGEDLSDLEPAMYIPGASLAAIEKKALREDDDEVAYLQIADGLAAQTKTEAYFEVFPTAKIMSLFYDDEKTVAGYIKAANKCADYRSQVAAGELKNTMTAFEGIARKVEAKFNR